MTFSVTKSFLSTVVGLMWQKGLIRDVTDPVRDYMPTGAISSRGRTTRRSRGSTCCGRPATGRAHSGASPIGRTGPKGQTPADWPNRKLSEPGTRYKYNDVRVNVLALAALHVLAAAAARVPPRRDHGADRRLEHVALARLRELVDRSRRPTRPIDDGRRALGRRHVHLGPRHGAVRISVPAQRQVEGPSDRLAEMDRHGAYRPVRRTPVTAT